MKEVLFAESYFMMNLNYLNDLKNEMKNIKNVGNSFVYQLKL